MSNPIETLAELIDRHAAEVLAALGQSTDINCTLGHCLRAGLAKTYSNVIDRALEPNYRGLQAAAEPSNVAPMRAKVGFR